MSVFTVSAHRCISAVAGYATALGLVLGVTTSAAARVVVYGGPLVVAPPAMPVAVVPVARPGWTWTEGYWSWTGSRYAWVAGAWVPARLGYVYWPARWAVVRGGWTFVPARWAAAVR
jgi:hypothetical protein